MLPGIIGIVEGSGDRTSHKPNSTAKLVNCK